MKCPHCQTGVHEKTDAWFPIYLNQYGHNRNEYRDPVVEDAGEAFQQFAYYTRSHICAECRQAVIELARNLEQSHEGGQSTISSNSFVVWPRIGTRLQNAFPNAQDEVPDIYDDYCTACRLMDVSDEAAAAFSRKCMERMLLKYFRIEKNAKGRYPQLNNILEELVGPIDNPRINPEVPTSVAKRLHLVREYGNFAVHTTEDHATGEIIEVEQHEAEACLQTVEEMFDAFYEEPKRLAEIRRAQNQKLGQARRKQHKE